MSAIHTFKKDEIEQVRSLFFNSESWAVGASPGSSEHKVGTHPGKDTLPLSGTLTHTHTHS